MLTENRLSPLSSMSTRETGTLMGVRDLPPHGPRGGDGLENRLGYFGLLPGERVRIIGSGTGDEGVVLVGESHVCMAGRIARRLIVRVDEGEQSRCLDHATGE